MRQCCSAQGGSVAVHRVAVLQFTEWQCCSAQGGSIAVYRVLCCVAVHMGGSVAAHRVAVLQCTGWQCCSAKGGSVAALQSTEHSAQCSSVAVCIRVRSLHSCSPSLSSTEAEDQRRNVFSSLSSPA